MLISLLGAMAVDVGSGPIPTGGVKQRSVLAQLCREPNNPVSIDRLAEGIWGEQVPDRYRQNLQVYVSTWRSALQPDRSSGTPIRIVGHREAYELIAAPQEIDVSRYYAAAETGALALAAGRPDAAATALAEALSQWQGAPLADMADQPFAAEWISELEQHKLATLSQRIDADLGLGRVAPLIAELTHLVSVYPHIEQLWEKLAVALYRVGRQADSLAAIARARGTLRDELGVDLGPSLRETERRVLNHDQALMPEPPVTAQVNTVPVPLTSAIGRDGLLAELLTQLASGQRLVLLLGPGGVGKTRVALECAGRLRKDQPVVWIPLSDINDLDEAMARITTAAPDPGGKLLFLDNIEQLKGIGGRLRRLLEEHPDTQCVVTSRSTLTIPGLLTIEVGELAIADAVDLFIERARAVAPTLVMQRNSAALTNLCQRLDNLPLAIELAAARARTFSPDQLATELLREAAADSRGTDSRAADSHAADSHATDSDERHSSVVNAVNWSIRLLSESDRRLLGRLAVLDGAFDTAIAAALGSSVDRSSVEALVNVALVRPIETDAGRRFTMLTTVRTVARGLPEAQETVVLDALAQLWVAVESRTDLMKQPSLARLADVGAQLPMVRRVVARLIATEGSDQAATILLGQRRTLWSLGRQDEFLVMATETLATPITAKIRAQLSVMAGGAAYICQEDRAESLLSAVADLDPDDHVYRVLANTVLAVLCVGNRTSGSGPEAAARYAQDALDAADTDDLQLTALSAASWVAQSSGDHARAVEYGLAQLALARDDTETTLALFDLTLAQLHAHDIAGAEASATRGLAIALRLGTPVPLANAQTTLSEVRLLQSRPNEAAALMLSALSESRDRSDRAWVVGATTVIALAAVQVGRPDWGLPLLHRADSAARELGFPSCLDGYLATFAVGLGVELDAAPLQVRNQGHDAALVEDALELAEKVIAGAPH